MPAPVLRAKAQMPQPCADAVQGFHEHPSIPEPGMEVWGHRGQAQPYLPPRRGPSTSTCPAALQIGQGGFADFSTSVNT